ncbi:MAG: UDP-N-acetylmuramate--L-alanine ligase [Synergistaceae bacterium]|nr:UDP-N-acetylmuramate--L-alanine ligase [Synergistaceae bacterium]
MGIGGAGMSGLALLLAELGFEVSGCDMIHTSYIDKVLKEGVAVVLGHGRAHMEKFFPDLLIYSSAIAEDNEEILAARASGVAVAKRGEVLSWIFDSRCGIGVAGTHGKTTTSSMISLILEQAGMNPTLAIGGELCDIGVNAKLGNGKYMVAELDESDGSFEKFHPEISVITNVDWDHVNYFPTYESVLEAFARFIGNLKDGGFLVYCAEDPGLSRLKSMGVIPAGAVSYGWGGAWDWGAGAVLHKPGGGVRFSLSHKGEFLDEIELSISGEHNILNSLAACAVSHRLGVPVAVIKRTLRAFRGTKRRLQHIGNVKGVDLYDDYGHHPREIMATLSTLERMYPDRRLIVAFQPHRYTRTRALYKEFAQVLSMADRLLLLPVYQADEDPIPGISSLLIADNLPKKMKTACTMCSSLEDAVSALEGMCESGDIVLTIGAGDVSIIGESLLARANADSRARRQIGSPVFAGEL